MKTLQSSPPTAQETQLHENKPRDSIQAVYAGVGQIVVRFRYLVVLVWLLIAVGTVVGLPSLSSVTNSNNNSFLPSGQPSTRPQGS